MEFRKHYFLSGKEYHYVDLPVRFLFINESTYFRARREKSGR
jgi:hypothetical protein